MSVFLMGVSDGHGGFVTVTKCGNGHTDEVLDKINKQLKSKMKHIANDYDQLPSWLSCNRSLVPDFVLKDPKEAPVWEITGAEFSRSDKHTADGISIRFPRVTRIRDDKDWESATSFQELKVLFEKSKEKSDIHAMATEDSDEEISVPLYASTPAEESKKQTIDEDKKEAKTMEAKKRKKTQSAEDSASPSPKKEKKACKYGEKCYRKNPEHMKEFSH